MKYSMECAVNGNVIIGKQIIVNNESKEYILIPDQRGYLAAIKIVTKVVNPERYIAKIEPGEIDVKANITIDGDNELFTALIQEFQELESVLSFTTNGCLERIQWNEPKREFIPETDEEKTRISVRSIYWKKERPQVPCGLNQEEFEGIIRSKHNYASLIIPKAFFREGRNEFRSRRYIMAFYNFYFVIEDIYGQGKTKNVDISDVFKKSTEFREILRWLLVEFIGNDEKERARLKKFCDEEKVKFDEEGIIELLQKIRGNLHHYSGKSSKHIGTPFNNDDYENIAFITMGLAVRAILQKILLINTSNQ